MNANKLKAILFIVVFLIVVALIVYILAGSSGQQRYSLEEGAFPTVQVGQATPPEGLSATPTSVPTQTISVVTPTPEPTPTPTPEPTPTPIPVGQEIAKGDFKSQSGSLMDITANYVAKTLDDTHVTVSVSVDLEHFALYTIEGNTLNIAVNGQYQTVKVAAISYDGADKITTTLGSADFNVDMASGQTLSIPVQVEWHFGGTYAGMEINTIECGGNIEAAR